MKVVRYAVEARALILEQKVAQRSVGLVPTMGALHEGHISLIRESIKENDFTIVTIFVNPIQFNNPEDFTKYPKSIEEDLILLEDLRVNMVFMPSKEEMYPSTPLLEISFGHLDTIMEGKHRPGHFSGVATVVAKLLNIFSPTRAYFGQKDLQQYKIIERLVIDLSMDVELVMMPIIREENGLAMSSRNLRLSPEGRKVSSYIYQALKAGAMAMKSGDSIAAALAVSKNIINPHNEISIEYLELARFEDLATSGIDNETNHLVLCFAGFVEGVRLIDNVVVRR